MHKVTHKLLLINKPSELPAGYADNQLHLSVPPTVTLSVSPKPLQLAKIRKPIQKPLTHSTIAV